MCIPPFVHPNACTYRGRIAPSPTGLLHLGHARTFWVAWTRARTAGGNVLLRNDDLDLARCRREFTDAAVEDLHWLGLGWSEGPDVGGPHAPYTQSARLGLYRQALEQLWMEGLIFPCTRSRKDVAAAAGAPHEQQGEADEPVYPLSFRPREGAALSPLGNPITVNWRFRVPVGATVWFDDHRLGPQEATAGVHFGDFLVWRKDDTPAYQLACVVDDAAMGITEVVRGADLVTSTFRQLLLYQALGHVAPAFFHCPLMTDASGERLAKRHDSLSLRALREQGIRPEDLRHRFAQEMNLS